MQTVHFNPSEVALVFGVDVATVRRWIYRGILGSARTAGGHHRISAEQLDQFARKSGMNSTRSYVIGRAKNSRSVSGQEYYSLLITGQSGKRLLRRLMLSGRSVADIADTCISEAMAKVGAEWEAGKLPIYMEHRASAVASADVDALSAFVPEPQEGAPLVLLACTPGEAHSLPLEVADLVLKTAGWRRAFLGINLPLSELARAAEAYDPSLIVLSKTYSKPDEQYLKKAMRLPAKVVAGGPGWNARERKLVESAGGEYAGSFAELSRIATKTAASKRAAGKRL